MLKSAARACYEHHGLTELTGESEVTMPDIHNTMEPIHNTEGERFRAQPQRIQPLTLNTEEQPQHTPPLTTEEQPQHTPQHTPPLTPPLITPLTTEQSPHSQQIHQTIEDDFPDVFQNILEYGTTLDESQLAILGFDTSPLLHSSLQPSLIMTDESLSISTSSSIDQEAPAQHQPITTVRRSTRPVKRTWKAVEKTNSLQARKRVHRR
ncbi:uncharacterized protein LOC144444521 [Glandiceps talaboti]